MFVNMCYISVNSTCSVNTQLTHIDNIWVFLRFLHSRCILSPQRYGTVNYFEVLLVDVRNRCQYVNSHDLKDMHNVITYRVNGTLTQYATWYGDCYRCVNCCINVPLTYTGHIWIFNLFKYQLNLKMTHHSKTTHR